MKKIYVMGNILVDKDSLPLRILPELKKELPNINFLELDPSEDFPSNKELNILDTVINTKQVKLIKNIDKIQLRNICSLHDFDLGYNLKLMKKFGLINKVNIIGVPPELNEKKAIVQIKQVITSLFSENV